MRQSSLTKPGAPSAWVRRFAGLAAPGGEVLDLACGAGRHARLFLHRGHPVTGVDRDTAGVADLEGESGFTAVAADLEDGSPWPLPGRTFAAVVVANYLHRPLLPLLAGLLAPGGLLIYETFAQGNAAFRRPANPDFLLRPGELLDAVRPALTVVAYEHGRIEVPRRAVVQRICAIRATTPDASRIPLEPAAPEA